MDSDDHRLEVGALSETGYTREENQDRMSGARVPLGHLYIVADGMGGHKGGALAAQMAVEELQRHIGQAAAGESVDAVIEAAFKAANDAVYKKSNSGDPAVAGMGTTAVLLLIFDRVAKLAHVGDSRGYLYRNHTLSQLTTDHTIVQRMVEAGMLKPDEAADHPQSSVLERAIGSAPTVGVDIREHHLEEGDALLLCSDGLSGYVGDDKIAAVLRADAPVQDTTANLVRLALEAGGRDNVTVQLIRYGARRVPATPVQTRPLRTLPPQAPTVSGGPVRRERGLMSRLAVFAMAGILSGTVTAGLLVYAIGYRTTPNVNQLKQQLDDSNSARDEARQQVKDLQEQVQKLQPRPDAPPPPVNTTTSPPSPVPAPTKSKEVKKTTPADGTSQRPRKDSGLTKPASEDLGKRPVAVPESNKGTPSADKGTLNTDKGVPSTDNGTPGTDKGTPSTDKGTPVTDKGAPSTDKGAPSVPDDARPSSVTPPAPSKEAVEAGRPTGQASPDPAPAP